MYLFPTRSAWLKLLVFAIQLSMTRTQTYNIDKLEFTSRPDNMIEVNSSVNVSDGSPWLYTKVNCSRTNTGSSCGEARFEPQDSISHWFGPLIAGRSYQLQITLFADGDIILLSQTKSYYLYLKTFCHYQLYEKKEGGTHPNVYLNYTVCERSMSIDFNLTCETVHGYRTTYRISSPVRQDEESHINGQALIPYDNIIESVGNGEVLQCNAYADTGERLNSEPAHIILDPVPPVIVQQTLISNPGADPFLEIHVDKLKRTDTYSNISFIVVDSLMNSEREIQSHNETVHQVKGIKHGNSYKVTVVASSTSKSLVKKSPPGPARTFRLVPLPPRQVNINAVAERMEISWTLPDESLNHVDAVDIECSSSPGVIVQVILEMKKHKYIWAHPFRRTGRHSCNVSAVSTLTGSSTKVKGILEFVRLERSSNTINPGDVLSTILIATSSFIPLVLMHMISRRNKHGVKFRSPKEICHSKPELTDTTQAKTDATVQTLSLATTQTTTKL